MFQNESLKRWLINSIGAVHDRITSFCYLARHVVCFMTMSDSPSPYWNFFHKVSGERIEKNGLNAMINTLLRDGVYEEGCLIEWCHTKRRFLMFLHKILSCLTFLAGQVCWWQIPSVLVFLRKVFVLSSYLKDNFIGYRILGW